MLFKSPFPGFSFFLFRKSPPPLFKYGHSHVVACSLLFQYLLNPLLGQSLGQGFALFLCHCHLKPESTPFTFHLQWSPARCRVVSAISKGSPCDFRINPLKFIPSRRFCAFLRSLFERIAHRIAGALQKVANERRNGFAVWEADPKAAGTTFRP